MTPERMWQALLAWPWRAWESGYVMQETLAWMQACPACCLGLAHVHGEQAPRDWATTYEARDSLIVRRDWQ